MNLHILMTILVKYQRTSEQSLCQGLQCVSCMRYPFTQITEAIKHKRPLTLVLPAFPAKSANRQKTLSAKVDLGEVIGLKNLNALCRELHYHYPYGVQLIICSDGRVFNDVVLVNDDEVDIYQQGIEQIIKQHRLEYLSLFSLDDVYPMFNFSQKRAQLMRDFAEPLSQLRQRMEEETATRYQFNGMHRFIVEDQLVLKPHLSKNQIRKQAKASTYEVMRRSNAWSRLVATHFPHALRLSIHPQPCGSEKFGIQFLPATNRWATPWHNVLLKGKDGWQLIKRQQAEELGAVLKNDHYVLEAC